MRLRILEHSIRPLLRAYGWRVIGRRGVETYVEFVSERVE